MAVSILDNWDYRGKKPDFGRNLFETIDEMVAFSENYLPAVYECNVVENGNRYRYNVSNIEDPILGKWRLVESSGGAMDLTDYYKKTEVDTLLQNKVDVDPDKDLMLLTERQQLADNTAAIELLNADNATIGSVDSKVLDALNSAKTYTDEQVAAMNVDNAIVCDDKPTYDGVDTITYTKGGVLETTTEKDTWFYYTDIDGILKQTIFIDNDEVTINSAGTVDFGDYVSKSTDVVSDYTGIEVDTTKVPDLAALHAMETLIRTDIDGKVSTDQGIDNAGKILKVGDDGNILLTDVSATSGDSAENISYDNVDYPDMTNVKIALDSIIAKIYYVDTAITSFTMTPSATTYEKGASIPSLTFNWAYNKEVVTQTLTDCVLADATVRTATYNTPLTTTKTFTLTASDGTKSATRSIAISFRDKVYFGGAAQPDTYDSTFVLGLATANFATAKKGTYSMNVGAGQYGYLAIPTSFGAIDSVWIGGFEVTVDNCGAINFTNASGYTSSYTIYKTGQQGLGSITMEVK